MVLKRVIHVFVVFFSHVPDNHRSHIFEKRKLISQLCYVEGFFSGQSDWPNILEGCNIWTVSLLDGDSIPSFVFLLVVR